METWVESADSVRGVGVREPKTPAVTGCQSLHGLHAILKNLILVTCKLLEVYRYHHKRSNFISHLPGHQFFSL